MKRVTILCAALIVALTSDFSHADLSACGSKIRTVENLLQRLSEESDGETRDLLVQRPFRRIDMAAAKTHVDEAKAYMSEGLEFECQFHAVAALRALGYLL